MKKRIVGILLSGILFTTPFFNSWSVFADTQTDLISDGNDLESLAGVSIEQMQKDFENQSITAGENISDNSGIQTYTISEQSSDSFVYLSDLEYDPASKAGWGEIQKDKDVEGGTITLKLNDTVTYFQKGMGAHATSNLIYDISQYNQEYTRLSTYVGVDHAKNGKSDGAQFFIWGSKTGQGDWIQLDSTEILKPADNAHYFDINVQEYDYIKLEARVAGSNSSDHTVYGDLRLLKADYQIDSELYQGVKTVAEYDKEISQYSVEENYKKNKLLVLKREFVNRIGYQNIQNVYKENPVETGETLDWLFGDLENLQLFIEAGGYFSGTGYNALNALVRLYSSHSDDMSNRTYKKLLLATAAAYCRNIKSFTTEYGGNYVLSDAVVKYESFKKLYDDGQFIRQEQFERYPMELVRMVVDSKLDDSEIFWLRDWIEKKYPIETNLNNWMRYNGYGYTRYVSPNYGRSDFYSDENLATWNQKYGFLDYGISYGSPNLFRVWMVLEHGAICWGLAGLANTVNEVQGIPAVGTYQPGHEAYLTYSENTDGKGIWSIGDNIAGWSNSFTRWDSSLREYRLPFQWGVMEYNKLNRSNNTSYILLGQDALNDYDNYLTSMYYRLIANSYPAGTETHENALQESLKHYSKNLDSLYGLYKSYEADENTSEKEWSDLAKRVIGEYTYFPAPMVDLIDLILPHITEATLQIEIDMMENEALKKASQATAKESLQDGACRELAKALLGQNNRELATFSFDGEYANTIVINESYDESTIQVRVSLDGGNSWETFEGGQEYTFEHKIKLSGEQLKKINAEDDILVGLMGVDTNYRIDIKEGNRLNASAVYQNDNENLLLGSTAHLEYSIDEGKTWQDYESGLSSATRIEGNTTAIFRYKAYGTYLQGPETSYDFHENADPETSRYLPLKYVTLEAFSSQNSTSADHAAKNFIDGNGNTSWHTTFNKFDDKYYVVSFDQVRYINKLTYLPGGQNGRLKSGEIYVSYDGENWEKVHTFTDLSNNTALKTIDLNKNTEAKYLKIVATETYYNSAGEKNMYFSGKMLNFYEDTTQSFEEEEAEITYSTENWTNQDVTAKLKLPTGAAADETEYVFTQNGTHEFHYRNKYGKEKTVVAEVSWIDKDIPTGTVVYSTDQPTNGMVIATLTDISETDVEIISEGGLTHTFTDNGSFSFVLRDKAGNEGVVVAEVSWIDHTAPELGVEFNISTPTNQDVVATLTGVSEEDTILGDGSATHTFQENGSHEFSVEDTAGNVATLKVTVSWIDKTAPTAVLKYSEETWTNQPVKVEVTEVSEAVSYKDGSDGNHTFTGNGTYVFVLQDEAGNQSELQAEVLWIDKDKPNQPELFMAKTEQGKPVYYLNYNEDTIEILSVNGQELSGQKFAIRENGVYRYQMRMRDTGYIMEYEVVVDWIVPDPEEPDPEVPDPEVPDPEVPDPDAPDPGTPDEELPDSENSNGDQIDSGESNAGKPNTGGNNTGKPNAGTLNHGKTESGSSIRKENLSEIVQGEKLTASNKTESEEDEDKEVTDQEVIDEKKEHLPIEDEKVTEIETQNSSKIESKKPYVLIIGGITIVAVIIAGLFVRRWLWIRRK